MHELTLALLQCVQVPEGHLHFVIALLVLILSCGLLPDSYVHSCFYFPDSL